MLLGFLLLFLLHCDFFVSIYFNTTSHIFTHLRVRLPFYRKSVYRTPTTTIRWKLRLLYRVLTNIKNEMNILKYQYRERRFYSTFRANHWIIEIYSGSYRITRLHFSCTSWWWWHIFRYILTALRFRCIKNASAI